MLSRPPLCPDIPVLTSATRATRIGYRSLSRRSASVIPAYGYVLRQANWQSFVGVVLTPWPTVPDADLCRREALWRSGYVPGPVLQSTCGLRLRGLLPPVFVR